MSETTPKAVADLAKAAPAPEIIRFEGVGKSFRTGKAEVPATRDVSLGVREGEVVTIVGPSGCGKSTTLNLVAGLFKPTTGTVHYRGKAVEGINRSTGYMTQSDHLLPWRDVVGNIAVPLEIAGVSRRARGERIAALVELVGLKGFERSYPSQLSGGMRKRTALARLLAYDPETLLLDEPFAALDAQLRIRMQNELLHLSRQLNKTVLFVTHDLSEAIALGDRCLVFSGRPGSIIQTIDIPLPRNRDLVGLRKDPTYHELCGQLWEFLMPSLQQEHP